MDAVFNPRCITDEGWWVLKQEGWRYVDEGDGLEVRGVVHSEMLGAYSDPDEILFQVSQNHLFPDTTYRFDSGGDPSKITSLTREQYISFYNDHYHPTNSKTFVNGNLNDVEVVMTMMDSYMNSYEMNVESREMSRIPYQEKKFGEPIRVKRPYASTDEAGSGRNTLITWLLDDESSIIDIHSNLALLVLDDILLGSTSSVLQKALLDSGLGEDVYMDGIDTSMLQTTFQVGMKGVDTEINVKNVEKIVLETLETLAETGFDDDDIQSSLNSVEFALREFSTSSPKGIVFYTRIMSKWNYDIHPVEALAFEDPLAKLRNVVAETGSDTFRNLIQDLLLNNNHRVVVDLFPDKSMEKKKLKEEKHRLADLKSKMSPKEYQEILEQTKALEDLQSAEDSPELVAAIPSLSLKDLDEEEVEYPIEIRENAYGSGVTTITNPVPSSEGIVYYDFGLDMSRIEYNDIPLIPLLKQMLMKTGTANLSDVELDRQIGIHTGGISISDFIQPIAPDSITERIVTANTKLRTLLFVRGKCLAEKSDQLFALISNILSSANLNSKDKAKQILREHLSSIESDIQSDGELFVERRIRARYSTIGFLDEVMSGSHQVEVLRELLEIATNDWDTLHARLEGMKQKLLSSSLDGAILNLSGDRGVLNASKIAVKTFLVNLLPKTRSLPSVPVRDLLPDFSKVDHPWIEQVQKDMKRLNPIKDEAIIAGGATVSYVGKGGIMWNVGDNISGSATVVSKYIQNGYLWDSVRVKNGAYGAFSSLFLDGDLIFSSYRDPNIEKTLDAYDDAGSILLDEIRDSASFTAASRKMAVIGAIGRHDGRALSTDEVGWLSLSRWLRRETAVIRQAWRNQILNTSVEDFEDFALRLKNWGGASVCVVTSQASLDKATETHGSPDIEVILTV